MAKPPVFDKRAIRIGSGQPIGLNFLLALNLLIATGMHTRQFIALICVGLHPRISPTKPWLNAESLNPLGSAVLQLYEDGCTELPCLTKTRG